MLERPMAERTPAVLGLDVGTTEAKAALVGLDGRLLGLGRAAYPMDLGPGGRAEQDARLWRAALAEAVSSLAPAPAGGRDAPEILAICCVAQGPTLVAVDVAGEPVRPAITWQDRRAGGTGFGLLSKMAWLARVEPEAAARAAWLLPAWDAMGLWLSGEATSSLQGHETVPSAAELAGAGVRASQVPAARPFGSRLGVALRCRGHGPRPPSRDPGRVRRQRRGGEHAGGRAALRGRCRGHGRDLGWHRDLRRPPGGAAGVPGLYQAPAPIPGRWVVGGAMAALGASVGWLLGAPCWATAGPRRSCSPRRRPCRRGRRG